MSLFEGSGLPNALTNNSSRLMRYITLGYIQPRRERPCLLSSILQNGPDSQTG